MTTKATMPVSRAAAILGVSPGYLHRFDAELQPERDRHGRRWFDPEAVQRLAEERAARKSGGAR